MLSDVAMSLDESWLFRNSLMTTTLKYVLKVDRRNKLVNFTAMYCFPTNCGYLVTYIREHNFGTGNLNSHKVRQNKGSVDQA